ncbi:AT-rich interactive domain-containing protein 5B isoform X2 [Esox lucius]|nr:AT-rich interactive domain-containing protein 5B isoform X2 [Esox lucius]
MEPNSLMWVGSPCGLHGPYIFYKAFRFHLETKPRILSLGDFFLVRCKPGEPLCIAELQLLWEERTSKQLLSSSKLYFLPEDTPQGRTVSHGEDEVVAVSEKVVVKLEDLVRWTVRDSSDWNRGLKAVPLKPSDVLRELGKNGQRDTLHRYRESTLNSGLNFKDVLKEKAEIGDDADQKRVLVLSYPQYCRYRSVLARLRERPASLLTSQVVLALGGVASLTEHTHILYCRDTFEHPTLIDNDSICDGFAPNLKGRPRKKKLSISQRRDSQNAPAGKETCSTEAKSPVKVKPESKAAVSKGPKGSTSTSNCKRVSSSSSSSSLEENTQGGPGDGGEECRADEQAFLVSLYQYMKERKTPIERIPYLGFKQINLWTMFQAAEKLGGYELITARRQWKNVYDELGGNPGSTSAATCTRRHYERLILPYERFTKGEEDKPLPPAKPRKDSPSQDGVPKTKVSPVKQRPKEEQPVQPPQTEQDPSTPGLDHPAECEEKERSPAKKEVQLKQDAQPPQFLTLLAGEPVKKRTFSNEEEELTVKEEAVSSCGPERAALLGHSLEKNENQPLDTATPPEAADVFLRDTPTPPDHAPPQDKWQEELLPYIDPCPPGLAEMPQGPNRNAGAVGTVGTVLPMLQQRPLQSPRIPETLKDRADLPGPDDSGSSYPPPGYPGKTHPGPGTNPGTNHPGVMNPGIMSPLAKKKLLSQVSGTVPSLPNHYAFGPPPPLVNTGQHSGGLEELAGQPAAGCRGSASDAAVVKRPSVIQHAQSFKPPSQGPGDREREREGLARDLCRPGEPYTPCDPTQRQTIHHPQAQHPHPYPNCAGDTYLLRPDPHPHQAPRPGHAPSFLSDYYSSPHLHSLYRHPEIGLGQEPLSQYLDGRERETAFPRDCEAVPGSGGPGFSPSRHPETMGLGSYCSHVTSLTPSMTSHSHTHRDMSPGRRASDDQPTDLSLPKPSPHKPLPSLHGPPHPSPPAGHREVL